MKKVESLTKFAYYPSELDVKTDSEIARAIRDLTEKVNEIIEVLNKEKGVK